MGHNDYVENIMREQLPNFLKKIGDDEKIDFLFITGDLIYSPAYPDQISQLKKPEDICSLVKAIQDAIGVGNDSTCISIGNHDVVRNYEKNEAIKKSLTNYRTEKGEIDCIDKIYSAEARFSDLYYRILKREYQRGHNIELLKYYSDDEEHEIGVLNIDTVISAEAMSEDNKTRLLQDGNLIIGIKHLEQAINLQYNNNMTIATGHHPLTALSEDERSAVIQELQKVGITVYLCGHTHIANIKNIGNDTKPLIQICCGTNMERLQNQNPADMKFCVGFFDMEKKYIEIKTFQYKHINGLEWGWEMTVDAPFSQNQFEKDNSITTFCYPKNMAPYYTIIDKMGKSLGKVVYSHDFYVEPELEQNPKRPPSNKNNYRVVIEADTGFGKTKYLKHVIYEQLALADGQKINDCVMNEERSWPFFIDLGKKHAFSKNDSILTVLAKSIRLLSRSSQAIVIFNRWISILANSKRLALYVDGLDRLDTSELFKFSEIISNFLREYPYVKMYVTSKYYVFESSQMLGYFDSFNFYLIKELSSAKIKEYCYLWCKNDHELNEEEEDDDWEKKASNITEQIINDESFKNLACVPLLLDTMLQLSKENNDLPKNRVQLYERFVYDLLKNEKSPEADIKLLAAIAFEMNEEHVYSFSQKKMTQIVEKILTLCDWFQLDLSDDIKKEGDAFLNRMDTKSRILKKNDNNYSFYNTEVRDYFTSLALSKGYYAGLKKMCNSDCLEKKQSELPLLQEIRKYLNNIECGNVLELTTLQLNTFETYIVVNELINNITKQDSNREATIVSSSYLRNLLLRVILHGANVIKDQREQSFAAVLSNQKIFGLQARLLEEVWNSRYSNEFEKQCTKYLLRLFSLLRTQSNPIGYLYTTLKEASDPSILEENLYVLDGVFWSKGREYLDVYKKNRDIGDIVELLEEILKSEEKDLLCKRRAFGVLHRLLEIKAINSLNAELVPTLFEVFEFVPDVPYRDSANGADKYAGIRIFHAIPLDKEIILTIKSIEITEHRKDNYRKLFEEAKNPQDRLNSFEAAIFCKIWTIDEINQKKLQEPLFKSAIINIKELNERIDSLIQHGFFE